MENQRAAKSDSILQNPRFRIAAVVVGVLLIIIIFYMVSGRVLTHYVEQQMNQRLKGYTVHVENAFFHPLTFALSLSRLVIIQDVNPDPPVASIAALHASIHWKELFTGHIAGDLQLEAPILHIDLKHVRAEEKSAVPIQKKGWQEAFQSIYPIRINRFTVRNGELTYVDVGPYRPLRATDITLTASNIRNIRYPDRVYPSPVSLEAKIFDKGRLILDGNANFLEEPHFGVKAAADLKDMDISYFQPLTARVNVSIKKGITNASGYFEYSPKITSVNLRTLNIQDTGLEYEHLPSTKETEKQRVRKAGQTAKELSDKPSTQIRIEVLQISGSSFSYINKTSEPNFRLFIDHLDAVLDNFSNQFAEGPAALRLTGKFMGTGDTKIDATFRSERKSPDFTIRVAIVNTQMPAMSDLFKAYGNFDIKAGLFSFYSELSIKNRMIDGYVKPMFQDLEVTDRRSPQQKSLFHKLYVAVVGALAKLLENPKTEKVATEAPVHGRLEGPRTNTWQVIINLIRNAFIRSILPGFEREITKQKK